MCIVLIIGTLCYVHVSVKKVKRRKSGWLDALPLSLDLSEWTEYRCDILLEKQLCCKTILYVACHHCQLIATFFLLLLSSVFWTMYSTVTWHGPLPPPSPTKCLFSWWLSLPSWCTLEKNSNSFIQPCMCTQYTHNRKKKNVQDK